ncbi:MAG TPA: helix-turn-helix domain-containing protein [Acidiferrobacteraceae bacterium]|nr:helix-turn-helix domain-containing protein [Acidiferrobacteraceae bacterium]
MSVKGEHTRADIVERAAQLFYAQGYDRTSFSDIVAAVGLHRGNIYHYFKTKEELLEAVIQHRVREFSALLAQWDARYTAPRARLLAFVHMIVLRQADLVQHGCPIGTLNSELAKDQRPLQRSARALFELFDGWLTEQFRALGYDKDAHARALHLLGRAQGVSLLAHVYEDARLLRREVAALEDWIGTL